MRYLVVGCGSIGRRHAANLAALNAGDISLCDPDPFRLEQAAKASGGRPFQRLEEALQARPDAALVCTPTHLHAEAAVSALSAGARLFLEKPVADTLENALKIERAAAGKPVMTACNMRFHPGVVALREALTGGAVTVPTLFRAWFSHYLPNWRPGTDYRDSYSARRSQGGGIIMECTHEIDYLRWLAGEAELLRSFAARVSNLEIDSEDFAVLLLAFERGATGQLQIDYLSPHKTRGCEALGPDGIVRWSSEGKSPERVLARRFDSGTGRWTELYRNDAYDANEMYLAEMKRFVEFAAGKSGPAADLRSGIRTLEIALAAQRTASWGEPVRWETEG